ncbi:MAG: hypothetical protein ACFFKA_19470 [Candidatus Thorarchaeota archaeon]
MSNKDNFVITLEKVRQIYVFLTEKEPTPDDEIEAREELIGHFRNLINLNKDPTNSEIISEIFFDLQEWDTLELWFSETSLPGKVAQLLNLPERLYKSSEPSITTETMSITEDKNHDEIDLTDIFNKVSEQFQGEIESLKGKIENFKRQIEKKD